MKKNLHQHRQVLNNYLNDTDEISTKVLPIICKLVSKFPDLEKT